MQYSLPSSNPDNPEQSGSLITKPLSWFELCKLALFKPGVNSFTRIAEEAKRGKDPFLPVLLSIILSISFMLGILTLFPNDQYSTYFNRSPGIGFAVTIIMLFVCLFPVFVFTQLLGYYAFAGSNYVFARLLGGCGGWKETLLTFSVLFIPFTFLQCILGALPYGIYIVIALTVYFTVLVVISIKVVHHISWFKSILAVVIIPLVILGGLTALMYFGLIKPFLPQVLEQLQQQYPGGFNV